MKLRSLQTGDAALATQACALSSGPLGSCIALILIETKRQLAGMAHIMLPGRSSSSLAPDLRYTEDATDYLMNLIMAQGGGRAWMVAYALGAGNVLKRADDTICASNIRSVTATLEARKIPLQKQDLGGFDRRLVILDLAQSQVRCSVGDHAAELFVELKGEWSV